MAVHDMAVGGAGVTAGAGGGPSAQSGGGMTLEDLLAKLEEMLGIDLSGDGVIGTGTPAAGAGDGSSGAGMSMPTGGNASGGGEPADFGDGFAPGGSEDMPVTTTMTGSGGQELEVVIEGHSLVDESGNTLQYDEETGEVLSEPALDYEGERKVTITDTETGETTVLEGDAADEFLYAVAMSDQGKGAEAKEVTASSQGTNGDSRITVTTADGETQTHEGKDAEDFVQNTYSMLYTNASESANPQPAEPA